ncbi:MAG: hypothetical protein Q4Q06_06925 [Bacteroidota bacterium]|nr:hypothetical protein [Bacteroidota bacterium]
MNKLTNKLNNINYVDDEILNSLYLNINGKENKIILKNIECNKNSRIVLNLTGDNNSINITGVKINKELRIVVGAVSFNFKPVNNHFLDIGKNTSIESMIYESYNSNTGCTLGEECMVSFDVLIFNTDAHPILDYRTKKMCNYLSEINIGKHCWIGRNAVILKNSVIADDCIVGGTLLFLEGILRHTQYTLVILQKKLKTVKPGTIMV